MKLKKGCRAISPDFHHTPSHSQTHSNYSEVLDCSTFNKERSKWNNNKTFHLKRSLKILSFFNEWNCCKIHISCLLKHICFKVKPLKLFFLLSWLKKHKSRDKKNNLHFSFMIVNMSLTVKNSSTHQLSSHCDSDVATSWLAPVTSPTCNKAPPTSNRTEISHMKRKELF